MLPFKIEVSTNIKDQDLTVEDLTEIIETLKNSVKHIRADFYSQFLNIRYLYKELVFDLILFILYYASKDIFYLYCMPISLIIVFIFSCSCAELFSNKAKQVMLKQIEHYQQLKNKLMNAQAD